MDSNPNTTPPLSLTTLHDFSLVTKETMDNVLSKIMDAKLSIDTIITMKIMTHPLCLNNPKQIYRNIKTVCLLTTNVTPIRNLFVNQIWNNISVAYDFKEFGEQSEIKNQFGEVIIQITKGFLDFDNMSNKLFYEEIMLLFLCSFTHPNNFLTCCPHWDRDTRNCYQYLCGVSDLMIIFYWLLQKIYKKNNVNENITMKQDVGWQFDNICNPVETNLIRYMKSIRDDNGHPLQEEYSSVLHNIITKSPEYAVSVEAGTPHISHNFPYVTFCKVLDNTYDFEKFLSKMETEYNFEVISDAYFFKYDATNEEPINFKIWAHILMQAMINDPLVNYLKGHN
jgi:hypothetical protein